MLTRLMAWELNTGFWTDVVFGEIQARVDSARFAEILPYYPSDAPTIIPGGQHPEPLLEQLRNPILPQDTVHRDSVSKPDSTHHIASALSDLSPVIEMEGRMRKFLGIDGAHIGSNAWAISGSRTVSGKPMLANDPHLTHTAPSRWYQAVIVTKENRLAGVTIPGCPFIVIGRNKDIAWGITSLMADETDFYVERPDSANKKAVMRDGRAEKLTMIRDTIAVKDSASVPMMIRVSRHGPIISDVHPFAEAEQAKRPSRPDTGAYLAHTLLAMRWRGNDVSEELAAWQGINGAHNLKQFTAAARLGGVPSLSFVYADRSGTIAYIPTVRVPIRDVNRSDVPFPGWDSRYDWKGTVPMEKLPTLVDPESGYIASANNKVANNLPYQIGDLWEDPSRAIRLNELLKDGNNYGPMDFVQIQGDLGSPHMRYMTEFLLRAFPDSAAQPPLLKMALHRLRSWDGRMLADAPEAAIAAVWLQTVIEMTYRDELGPTLFSHYVRMAQLPLKAIRYHVMIDSRWFDDVTTPNRIEHRDDILRMALGRALDTLHGRFGTWDMGMWRFGAIHTLTLPHPFDRQEKLRSIVDIGPYEIGGSNTTLNNGEWSFNEPYHVVVGPSMRQIVDFGDTTAFLRSVITTGESGQPLNQFYKNQTILWLSNGYLMLNPVAPQGSAASSVTYLRPKEED
jgi:penicillin amidase